MVLIYSRWTQKFYRQNTIHRKRVLLVQWYPPIGGDELRFPVLKIFRRSPATGSLAETSRRRFQRCGRGEATRTCAPHVVFVP